MDINSLKDIHDLITNQVEENIHLDYKAADSLGLTDAKKKEISKDVSAFLNSDGGTIVYGVKEYDDTNKKYLPEKVDPVDRNVISKEWLEQVILSNISPRPSEISVHPIPIDNANNTVIYVVRIPKSTTAHQAKDLKYYRRNNFENIPMYDFEIKDIMNRNKTPKIEMVFEIQENTFEITPYVFSPTPTLNTTTSKPEKKFGIKNTLNVFAKNIGGVYANYVNCYLYISADLLHETENKYYRTVERYGLTLKEIYCDNTIREVKEVQSLLNDTYYKYWPSRYDPILPGTHLRLKTIVLKNDLDLENAQGMIYYTIHADNADKIEGEHHIAELKIYKTTEAD